MRNRVEDGADLHTSVILKQGRRRGRCFVISLTAEAACLIVSAVVFTHECDMLGVAVTVYRMWLKTLIRVLTLCPHSVHMEFVLWVMALTMIGSIWPSLPALALSM